MSQPASSLTLVCPPGQQGQNPAEGVGRMAGSLTMGAPPLLPTAQRSRQRVGTGGGTLFLLARTVAFRKVGASSLGW